MPIKSTTSRPTSSPGVGVKRSAKFPSWFFLASCGFLIVLLVSGGLVVLFHSPDNAESAGSGADSTAAQAGGNTRGGLPDETAPAMRAGGASGRDSSQSPDGTGVIQTRNQLPEAGAAESSKGNLSGGRPSRRMGPNQGGSPTEKLPAWVPIYGGIQPQGVYYGKGPNGTGGEYQFVSKDSMDNLINYYKNQLENAGYEVQLDDFKDSEDIKVKTLNGQADGGKRTINVMLSSEHGKITVMVNFNDKDEPALGQ